MKYTVDLTLFCVLLAVNLVKLEFLTEEGSGDFDDSDEMDEYDLEDLEESSGEFIEDLKDFRDHRKNLLKIDKEETDDFDFHFRSEDDLYDEDEYNEILDNLDNYMYGEEKEDFVLKEALDELINIEKKQNIEIKPKPSSDIEDDFMLDTSQILIMIGSAFISFGLVMLAFFICQQRLGSHEKVKGSMPYILPSKLGPRGPPPSLMAGSPIVKDYQRVPTTTQEYLASKHIEMYRGSEDKAMPLLRSPSSGV